MKKVLSTALTVWLGFSSFAGLAQQQTLEDRIRVSNPMIEREIRKWGSVFANDSIESDYSDNKRTKIISFFLGDSDDFLMSPYYGAFAEYSNTDNSIRLPIDFATQYARFFSKSIHHEIAHYFFDSDGLLSLPDYKGPSKEELLGIGHEDMNSEQNILALQEAEKRFLASIDYRVALQRFEDLVDVYNSIIGPENRAVSDIFEIVKKLDEDKLSHIDRYETEFGRIVEIGDDDLSDRMESLRKQLVDFEKHFSHDDVNKLQEMVSGLNTGISDLTREMREFRIKSVMERTNALRRFEMELSGLWIYGREFTGKIRAQYEEKLIELTKRDERLSQLQMERYLTILNRYDNFVDNAQQRLREDIIKRLSSREEFVARQVGAIATLDVGNPSFDTPTISDKMLDALDRMTYKGQKVLGHMIARFRLAQELKRQGDDPSYIPRTLEGNLFILNGIKYDFRTGNGYTIIGMPQIEGKPH